MNVKTIIEAYREDAHPVKLMTNQGWMAYWLLPGRLAAGVHPSPNHVQELEAQGVSAFINLTEVDEIEDYRPVLAPDTVYVQHPIVDFSIPQASGMREILDEVHRLVAAENVLYVHCWAGVGRTGTVIGCYLVEVGFTADEALDIIQLFRTGALTGRRDSPQTAQQEQFIRDWKD